MFEINKHKLDFLDKFPGYARVLLLLRMFNIGDADDKKVIDKHKYQDNDFELISNDVLNDEEYKSFRHASHCMIYSKSDALILNTYNTKALIMMQFRFDGHLGFPGGMVDPGEDATTALNRELSEEVGISELIKFEEEDKAFIHCNRRKSLILHFYIKEVSNATFEEIETKAVKSSEYGNEVLGILRIPLYTMYDGFRGFPAFLQNKFIGNAKNHLLSSLIKLKLMSSKEIDKALSVKSRYL